MNLPSTRLTSTKFMGERPAQCFTMEVIDPFPVILAVAPPLESLILTAPKRNSARPNLRCRIIPGFFLAGFGSLLSLLSESWLRLLLVLPPPLVMALSLLLLLLFWSIGTRSPLANAEIN